MPSSSTGRRRGTAPPTTLRRCWPPTDPDGSRPGRHVIALIPLRLAAVALLLAASGCGASATIGTAPSASSPAPAPSGTLPSAAVHDDADVAFASTVLVLHRRAVAAAAPAAQRAVDPRVRALAGEVGSVDEPEIDSLTSYLDAWGAPVPPPEAVAPHEQPGTALDQAFLDTLLASAPAVVAAARREQQDGRYEPARELAGLIIGEQTSRAARARALRG